MEKVQLIKSGRFALHSACGPIVDFEVDDVFKGELIQNQELVKNGWAVDTDQELEGELDEPVLDTIEKLQDIVSEMEEPDAKDKIKQWGIDNYGISISRAKSVSNMLAELLELEQANE